MCCLFELRIYERYDYHGTVRTHVSRCTANRTSKPDKENEVRKDITVAAEVRTSRGKNEARRTRAAGQIPAVVYGAYQDPVSVAVNPREISKIIRSSTATTPSSTWRSPGGENTP